jgi:hypothetical protein
MDCSLRPVTFHEGNAVFISPAMGLEGGAAHPQCGHVTFNELIMCSPQKLHCVSVTGE